MGSSEFEFKEYPLEESKEILSPAESEVDTKKEALEEIKTKIQSLKSANSKLKDKDIEEEITILEQMLAKEKTIFEEEVNDYLEKYGHLQISKKKLMEDLLAAIKSLSEKALENEENRLKKVTHIGINIKGFNKKFKGYAKIGEDKKFQFTNEDLNKLDEALKKEDLKKLNDYSLEKIKTIMEGLLRTSNSTAVGSKYRTNKAFGQLEESLNKNECTVQFQEGTIELKFSEELCQEELELSKKKHFGPSESEIKLMNTEIKRVAEKIEHAAEKIEHVEIERQLTKEVNERDEELNKRDRAEKNKETTEAKKVEFFKLLIATISNGNYWRNQCRQFPLSTRVPTGIEAMQKIVHEYNDTHNNWLSNDLLRQEFIEKLKKVAQVRLDNPRVGCFSCFSFFTLTRKKDTADFYGFLNKFGDVIFDQYNYKGVNAIEETAAELELQARKGHPAKF